MSGFERDAQLDEILSQIRRKREEEEAYRAARNAGKGNDGEPPERLTARERPETAREDPLQRPDSETVPAERTARATRTASDAEDAAGPEEQERVSPPKEDVRSLRTAFAGAPPASPTGEINKRMVASAPPPEAEPEFSGVRAEPPVMTGESAAGTHPLFTTEIPKQTLIPEEDPALRAAVAPPDGFSAQGGVMLEEFEQIERKGVLNVKENVDDEEFKTFFSNTVLIDSKPLAQRRPRPKRITDFVVGEEGGPVFAEDDSGGLSEYRSDDETEDVMALLMRDAGRSLLRMVSTAVISALIILFNLLLYFKILLPEAVTGSQTVIAAVNAGLMFAAAAIHCKSVFPGLLKLVTFRADSGSVTAFAALMGVLEPALMLAMREGGAGFAAPVASVALFFSALGERISAKRVLQNFANISADYEKYATTTLPEDAFAKRLTRDMTDGDSRILIKRKTGFTDDFLAHAASEDLVNETIKAPASIVFLIAVACGVIDYLLSKDIVAAVRRMALASVLVTPFTATLASALPFARMQRHLSRIGCVVPGFSAADEVADGNCAVLEGREVFLRGNVLLHGIKTFEKERIDKAILYAASVLIQSCDTMAHMFLNVIQNKTEMLYPVDNIVYEDGMGFSCWAGKTRLLIGNRKMMKSREIEVPSRDYENRYTKESSRDAIYLAVAGKLYAMFIVSYGPSAEVKRVMRGFEREGIRILVRTRDFNITAERVSRAYEIPRSMVSVVSDHDMEELSRKTAYAGHSPSVMTHIGSLSSYVGGILACHKLLGALKIATTIELASVLVGALLALLTTLLSNFPFGIPVVFLFHTLWLAVTVLLGMLQRY